MNTELNPLLAGEFRIPFHEIVGAHVEPGIKEALSEAQAEIDRLAADGDPPTWQNTIERLDRTVEQLSERIVPVTHLISVAETPELREAYNQVLPEISGFWSRLPLNEDLWRRVKAFAETEEASGLEGLRRRHLDKTVREFERAGADLPPDAKGRLEEVRIELAQLQQTFSEIDQNNDGTISKDEMFKAYKILMSSQMDDVSIKEEVDRIFSSADRDGDGTLSFTEWQAAGAKKSSVL